MTDVVRIVERQYTDGSAEAVMVRAGDGEEIVSFRVYPIHCPNPNLDAFEINIRVRHERGEQPEPGRGTYKAGTELAELHTPADKPKEVA